MPTIDCSISLNQQVCVTASARLHMGFFDLTCSTERRFGGLGMAIDAPITQVQIKKSKNLIIGAKSSDNVVNIVDNFIKSFNLPGNFAVQVLQSIPEHAGLGSGTQLALAIGAGLNRLFSLNLTMAQIATTAMRGKRSGIGIGAFMQGGFLLDTGKLTGHSSNEIPAISSRLAFPENWRALLVLDTAHKGLHGDAESQAFQHLKPPQNSLQKMVVQNVLPALLRADLLTFGACMHELQAYNGDYFAPAQGGRYASQDVTDALIWLQSNGVACVGQSSWGPTGFAILENQQLADNLQAQAQLAFTGKPNINFKIVRAKNTGASLSGIGVSESSASELTASEISA